jgi:hypothetical protein
MRLLTANQFPTRKKMLTKQPTSSEMQTVSSVENKKQAWETPELRSLDVDQTESGATPGAPESTLKAPAS